MWVISTAAGTSESLYNQKQYAFNTFPVLHFKRPMLQSIFLAMLKTSFQQNRYSLFLGLHIHRTCHLLNMSGTSLAGNLLVTDFCSCYRWTFVSDRCNLEWSSLCTDTKSIRFDTTSFRVTSHNPLWPRKMMIFEM